MVKRSNFRIHETEHTLTTLILMSIVWFLSPHAPIELPNGSFQPLAMIATGFILVAIIMPYHDIKGPYIYGAAACGALALAEPLHINPLIIVGVTYGFGLSIALYVVIAQRSFTKFREHGKKISRRSRWLSLLLDLPFGAGIVIGVPIDYYRNLKANRKTGSITQ